ncbi:SCO2522 family protein [Glycomyces sp. L485]|uniref:SCO2522 family protein n=1 Tax=Glycomyces sp. L485 TaxID=2909235 RepID=UPI001F4A36BE|nr:SCO2522 family protein [Glycomyces sp. L485]MCH7231960.1 SCO2522 family protein [Glycomyces sp. L485]
MSYSETSAKQATERFGMSHLSIEVGHLYADDLAARPDALRAEMASAAAWVRGTTEALAHRLGGRRPRVSTCYLVDDYFHDDLPSPEKLVAAISEAAADAGLRIDYLARESGCARMGELDLAALVAGRIVFEPTPGTNGSRPPVSRSGWLCNGVPTPQRPRVAMSEPDTWRPPSQNSAREHSIFLDVELWNDTEHGRRWSCPMLAAVWQLMRLGVLRNHGKRIGAPVPVDQVVGVELSHEPGGRPAGRFPDQWSAMPPIIQLDPEAFPFPAYRTVSVLSGDFLEVEHAVRVICSCVRPDPGAFEAITKAAAREKVDLPAELVDRLSYIFQGPL